MSTRTLMNAEKPAFRRVHLSKAPEGTDEASFLADTIDYVQSVKMVDSWEE